MPRENKEPIEKCNQCRFEILGMCRRNPPTSVWFGGELSSWYPAVRGMEGCFAGELKEQAKPEGTPLSKEQLDKYLIKVECCFNCEHWNNSDTYDQYTAFCKHRKIMVDCDNKCKEYEHE
jgi:hypothetical protein